MNWSYDYKEKIGFYWYFLNYKKLGASLVYRSVNENGGKDIAEVFKGSIDECNDFLLKEKDLQNVEKELKVDGVFYLPMLKCETKEQAIERFWKLTNKAGIIANDGCCTFEDQEL